MVADSVSRAGVRLSTIEVQFPRIVLAEFNTHRMLSRNSASSRAIPVARMISMVKDDPYVPTEWGVNRPGMQATELLSAGNTVDAECAWLHARDQAVEHAEALLRFGVHKQLANRLLEPFMWHTVIVTATEWDNFFHLRRDAGAHPEIRKAAECMWEVMQKSKPVELGPGEWHLPYVTPEDLFDPLVLLAVDLEYVVDDLLAAARNAPPRAVEERELLLRKLSVARCARVSYLTHDRQRNLHKDVISHDARLGDGHMSPFEHVARPAGAEDGRYAVNAEYLDQDQGQVIAPTYLSRHDASKLYFGNLRGWVQYRKLIPHERDILARRYVPVAECGTCGHRATLHDAAVRAQLPNPWFCPCCLGGIVG